MYNIFSGFNDRENFYLVLLKLQNYDFCIDNFL